MQKFISIVDLSYDYELYYSGTPPNNQFFRLEGAEDDEGAIFSIQYPNAGTFWLYDSAGKRIQPIVFSPSHNANNLPEITWNLCGEHRYQQTNQIL